MTGNDKLDYVLRTKDAAAIQRAYQDWADSYDAENLGKGYRLPGLAAAFMARNVAADADPLLDAGCGTGLVGGRWRSSATDALSAWTFRRRCWTRRGALASTPSSPSTTSEIRSRGHRRASPQSPALVLWVLVTFRQMA